MVVDVTGKIYAGGTSAATWGSPFRVYTSGVDAYVAQVDNSGYLIWNTFLGGGGTDKGQGIILDGSENVYLAGCSDVTWGSPVHAYGAQNDAMIVKICGVDPTDTPTQTATATPSMTPSFTTTPSPTSSVTVTSSVTPSFTETPSVTPSPTQTQFFSSTDTPTGSSTPTSTESPSNTFTPTETFSPTPFMSITSTIIATATLTTNVTVTMTPTPTETPMLIPTLTSTLTPNTFLLKDLSNYPNPFHRSQGTTIRYVLTEDAQVDLEIFTYLGDRVWHTAYNTGLPGGQGGGENLIWWNGQGDHGGRLASGGYVLRIKARSSQGRETVATRKVLIMNP